MVPYRILRPSVPIDAAKHGLEALRASEIAGLNKFLVPGLLKSGTVPNIQASGTTRVTGSFRASPIDQKADKRTVPMSPPPRHLHT